MTMARRRSDFIDSDEGKAIKRQLQLMAVNSAYNTSSSYSANSSLYPDNQISFVDKHMNYLIDHPSLEPTKYLSNIRLVARVR